DHRLGALHDLFRGLEDKKVAAGQRLGALGQRSRRARQHRCVAVVAAGVHAPVVQGGEVDARLLPDGQRVDVGAEHDGAAGAAAFERGHGARLGGAVVNRETERGQARLDQLGGLELFEADLRVAVEVAARVNNLIEYSVCG